MKAYIVDSSIIRENLKNLKKRAGGTPIWAVLKGDGYGLGLEPMAALCADAGIDRFCVTELDDVRRLREAGYKDAHILMLRPTTDVDEIHQLLDLGAIFTVSSQDDATVLSGVAAQRGAIAEVHIKIDTGMGRYGFLPTELDKILPVFAYMDSLAVSGVYSHFSCAFCSQKQTRAAYLAFTSVLRAIVDAGYETGETHICNSAGLLRFPEYKLGGVRIGSAILGRLSFKGSYGLRRVGYCQARVDEVRWLPKGHTCGYGAGWKARHPTRIAVLPVGWYHGFGCEMGHDLFRPRDQLRATASAIKGLVFKKAYYVTLNGKRCKVLGHIGMLHTVVDVTNVPCAVGDTAIFDINPIMCKGMPVVFQ